MIGRRLPRVALVTLALLVAPLAGPATAVSAGVEASTALPRWSWPLPVASIVVRPYDAPADRYSAGHRGIDIATEAGVSVRAPASGVVSFRGWVVDRPVLTLSHPGGYLSSFEPVESSLQPGDRVERGQVVGVVSELFHCATSCLHLGVRLDGDYLSPLDLLARGPRAVLLPLP
ncbi:murein hydrolase activator EnvC [Agreia sp. COWG]|uniref:murein hydrolase activator EnvC family protein n=1 Tax=Agreia sp. COWG TaxID=2773266 RepID=UPI0019289986|nr:M23 family metallopeptidase [Agreia sp. COWG]